MKLKTLLTAIAESNDLTFESQIFEDKDVSNLVYIDRKDFPGSKSKNRLTEFDSGLPNKTHLEILQLSAALFQGKFKIESNTLRFESLEYWKNQNSEITLTEIREKTQNRDYGYTTNAGEHVANYFIEFRKG